MTNARQSRSATQTATWPERSDIVTDDNHVRAIWVRRVVTSMMMRFPGMRWCVGLFLAIVTFGSALACSSSGDAGPGVLLFGSNDGVVELDLETGTQRVIIARPDATTNLSDPVVSPDGSRVAYVLHPPFRATGGTTDVSSDLWLVNRDGSDARVLVQHVEPNETWDYPQWLDDTHVLVLKRTQSDSTDPSTARYSLQTVDTESGLALELIHGVERFGLSRDRTHLAYSRLVSDGRTLNLLRLGETEPVQLLPSTHQLTFFGTPGFSPDGATIAFSAFDRDELFAAAPSPSAELVARAPRAPAIAPDAAATLHGEHGSVFTLRVAGGEPAPVGEGFDANWQSSVTYSADGALVYVATHEGIFSWNVETGEKTTVVSQGFRTEVSWSPSPD
jgi:Tol biopolymer transport system component